MGKDVADKSDGTAESEEKPDVQSVREENRRLFELVDRLIATQESEQRHRKIIESELQQMKFTLVKNSTSADSDPATPRDAPDSSEHFEQLFEKLGEGLEAKILARLDGIEERVTAHTAESDAEDPKVTEALVNTIWKMIAPLGGELERLSSMVQGIGQEVDQSKSEAPPANAEIAQELKTLGDEIKQLRSEGSGVPEDAGKTIEALGGLNARLEAVNQSLEDLATRQDDARAQTETLLRDLIDTRMEHLSRDWAEQIADFQSSIDDLLLGRTQRAKPIVQEESNSDSQIADKDQDADVQDVTPNVVSGDFRGTRKAEDPSEIDDKQPDVISGGFSPDLKREMQAMDVWSDATAAKPVDAADSLSEGLADDLNNNAAEALVTEDALLTKPADWRTESETEEEAILLSKPIATNSDRKTETGDPEARNDKQFEKVDEAAAATSGGRQIDLRAFKDLRLSNDPGDAENSPAKLPPGEARSPSYENAPAEASLTRFVRLIRARKRSSPS